MVLGQNQYGKAECRVVRITRDPAEPRTHHIKDLNVSIALSGEMDAVHYAGDNAAVLPTDTAKNTVYALAGKHGIPSAEEFGIRLARHFVTGPPSIHRARVRVEEYAWERIGSPDPGEPRHSFVREGRETRHAQVTFDGEGCEMVSGLDGLTVLNSTDSEFRGFARDRYTTLRETGDRILATEVRARWRYRWTGADAGPPNWDAAYRDVREHLLAAFAGTYSRSLQQTLHAMGARVLDRVAEVEEIRLSLPNRHHFLVDLEPFGLANDNEVYLAADRPYGLIEATVLREGATARIPVS